MNRKILLTITVLAIAGVGYWLLSPLFIDRTVNERADDEIAAAIENLGKQVEEDQMDSFRDEMMKMNEEAVVMDTAMPSGEPQVLASGKVTAVDHEGSGDVFVVETSRGQQVLRFEDLDVLNGPDLRVLLSKESNPQSSDELGEYVEVGKLKGNVGDQNYVLSSDIDIEEYSSVVIYCKPFGVVFNVASF